MKQQQRIEILQRLHDNDPNPSSELNYSTTFELLIAVILSAQATDKSVNKVTAQLFKIANTPQAILELGETKLKQQIKTIGLYNSKAQNIIKTCHELVEKYANIVPNTRAALESLAGVGRKTANVVLNIAFQQPTIAVDTHIFRVCNRTQLAPGKSVTEVENKLNKVIPTKYKLNAHHWLLLHGRYVCKAAKPHCQTCIIEDLCQFKTKNLAKQ